MVRIKDYNRTNLPFSDLPRWLFSLKEPLELAGVAFSTFNLPAGKGYTFMHSHKEQEEVYIVLYGKGIMQLEEKQINLKSGDCIRVSPSVRRAIKARNESNMTGIIIGGIPKQGYPKHKTSGSLIDDGIPDWEFLPSWCKGNKKIIKINEKLKAEREAIKTAR